MFHRFPVLRILRIVFLLPRIFTCTRNQKLILAFFFFFFLVFSFQFRKLFLFKKNPPQAQSEKYSVGDGWRRRARQIRENYNSLEIMKRSPFQTELNLTKDNTSFLSLSSPSSFFRFFAGSNESRRAKANFSSDRSPVSRRKLLSIACLGN